MAVVTKVRRLSNPRRKRNGPKRRLTPKQIKHFGTKAQKAALKRKRRASALKSHRTVTRKRNVSHRRRANPKPRAKARRANPRRRRVRRSNPAPLLLTMGAVNPQGGKAVAHRKRTKKSNPTSRRRRAASNPRRRLRSVGNPRRLRVANRRRNPAVFGYSGGNMAKAVVGGLAGVAAAKMLPGFLPVSISGNKIAHVAATAASAFVAQFVAKKVGLGQAVSDAVLFGGLMQTGSDLITSFLPSQFNTLALGALTNARLTLPENTIRNIASAAGAVPVQARITQNGLGRAFGTAF